MSALVEIGVSAAGNLAGYPSASANNAATARSQQTASSDSTAVLQAQISREQVQLNDWVTCTSASTPKGKAEIQSISSQISAAQAHIRSIQAAQSAAHSASEPSAAASGTSSADLSTTVDAWA